MNKYQIIANVIMFLAGICSILSTYGKRKNNIVFIEFFGTILRIIGHSYQLHKKNVSCKNIT